ncbi:phage terminase small subunit P27 family [Liquorilactobacillus aquaticus]|nr:phage terminase small subunit P27 family [Liquorilactobacillus aquaticus]
MDSKKSKFQVVSKEKVTKLDDNGLDEIQITPPRHLMKDAQGIWRDLIPEIKKMGYLKKIDQSNLELYCTYYALYIEAEDKLKKFGTYLTDKNGVPVQKAPQAIQLNDCVRNLKKLGFDMGLTFDAGMRQIKINEPSKNKRHNPLKKVNFGAEV